MKCVLCGSTQHRLYLNIERDKYIHKEINYFKCNKCDLIFIKPQPMKELKTLYNKEYRSKIGFLKTLTFLFPFSRHHKPRFNYIKKHIRLESKGNVLDVGSSEGKFLYLLKLKGWNVLGVEPNEHYAEFANRVLKVPTIKGFIEDIKLDRKLDLITMNDVLEHLNTPLKTLKKVKTLLKKDGKLYVSVPDLKSGTFAAPHLFMYSKDTIAKLFRRAGFTIKSIDVRGAKYI